jgi:predicted amidophosphoribosyltransferase
VELCRACVAELEPAPAVPLPPGLDAYASVFAYEGVGRQLVLGLKYRNRRGDLAVYGTALAGAARPLLRGAEPPVLTWAPTTPARRRRRGYDQARWLAGALGRELGCRPRAVLRREPSAPQTGAARRERLGRPRFAVLPGRGDLASVLVVDDVCTSGATLRAAAAAVRDAGCENVVAVTLAQTPLNRSDRTAETLP